MSLEDELTSSYFNWLLADAFETPQMARSHIAAVRELHNIPFYWTVWLDENRVGDALAFRQSDFLGFYDEEARDRMDQLWLGNWAVATPSVFEVLMGMARRWSFYFDLPASHFFETMFRNLGLDQYPGKDLASSSKEDIRLRVDNWMSRQFAPNGVGSPFPITYNHTLELFDMRELDIWGQMNAYSAEHYQ